MYIFLCKYIHMIYYFFLSGFFLGWPLDVYVYKCTLRLQVCLYEINKQLTRLSPLFFLSQP